MSGRAAKGKRRDIVTWPNAREKRMCQAVLENGSFAPEFCPLLQDLSPEEIAYKITHDPGIRACIASVGPDPSFRAELPLCRSRQKSPN